VTNPLDYLRDTKVDSDGTSLTVRLPLGHIFVVIVALIISVFFVTSSLQKVTGQLADLNRNLEEQTALIAELDSRVQRHTVDIEVLKERQGRGVTN
jgi:cell division protein FtsL